RRPRDLEEIAVRIAPIANVASWPSMMLSHLGTRSDEVRAGSPNIPYGQDHLIAVAVRASWRRPPVETDLEALAGAELKPLRFLVQRVLRRFEAERTTVKVSQRDLVAPE